MPERDEDGQLISYRGPADSDGCATCPCATNGVPLRPVRAFGATGGLCCVGEAPGSEEVYQGYPFVGPSGRILSLNVFKPSRIDRQLVWVTNSLLCQRPRDDAAFTKAVECCRPRLEAELALVKPTAICALGGTAARALKLPVTVIMDARGTVQNTPLLPGVPVITTLHPAVLFHGGAGEMAGGGKQKMNVDAQLMFLRADIEKAYRISTGEIPPAWSDDIAVVMEPAEVAPALRAIVAEAREWGLLGIDLEWTPDEEITWMGLGTAKRAVSFAWDVVLAAEDALALAKEVFADETLPKLMHNLQADKSIWELRVGPMRGPMQDSMLMHHVTYPGISHELQQVASQFLVVPPWKVWHKNERKAAEKAAREEAKAAKKAAKIAAHEARNAARKAEAEAKKAAKKAEAEAKKAKAEKEKQMKDETKAAAKSAKQAEHEAKNAERAAEAAAKKAARQAAHEANNARLAAEAAARKAAKKAAPLAPSVPAPSAPAPSAPAPSAPKAQSGVLSKLLLKKKPAPAPASVFDAPRVAGAVVPRKRRVHVTVKDENGVEREIDVEEGE